MPTLAGIERMKNIREHFRQHHAGRVKDPREVKEDYQRRFNLDNKRWYPILAQLKTINEEYRGRVDQPQEVIPEAPQQEQGQAIELEIPAGLPENVKSTIVRLLEINQQLTADLSIKEVEMAGGRSQAAAQQARIKVLKGVIRELVEAI